MAVVAILITDGKDGVDVRVKGDEPMDETTELTPAQTIAMLMVNAAMSMAALPEDDDAAR